MKDIAIMVKRQLNEEYLSDISKLIINKIIELSKDKVNSNKYCYLSLYFIDSTGRNRQYTTSFFKGERNPKTPMIPIDSFTNDCYSGNIIIGDKLSKMKNSIQKMNNNKTRYGCIIASTSDNKDHFGILLSENGLNTINDIFNKKQERSKNQYDEKQNEYKKQKERQRKLEQLRADNLKVPKELIYDVTDNILRFNDPVVSRTIEIIKTNYNKDISRGIIARKLQKALIIAIGELIKDE